MNKKILVIAPHPDDETLGVGGTIAKYIDEGDTVSILTVSGHLPPLYSREDYEITLSEAKKAHEILGVSDSIFLETPATMIGQEPVHVFNKKIFDAVNEIEPEIVLCPYPDRHIESSFGF